MSSAIETDVALIKQEIEGIKTRQSEHEDKCDKRQEAMYGTINGIKDKLSDVAQSVAENRGTLLLLLKIVLAGGIVGGGANAIYIIAQTFGLIGP